MKYVMKVIEISRDLLNRCRLSAANKASVVFHAALQ